MEDRFSVSLSRDRLFQFLADFGLPASDPLRFDEPPPLGQGEGPNAARVLAAAVGACLAASALYCLERARIPVGDIRTTVDGELTRNEHGRLRIAGLAARLELEVAPEQHERIGRCVGLFEDFCMVTQSVRSGIPIEVAVEAVAPEPVG